MEHYPSVIPVNPGALKFNLLGFYAPGETAGN